jgi:hypothetical protein
MSGKPLCSVAVLFAIAVLPGSAFASHIGASTRAAVPPSGMLLQGVRCQRICRPQDRVCDRSPDGRMICRPAPCRVICHRR